MTVHFTVRLAMAAGRNTCRLLKTQATKLSTESPDLVLWCLPERQVGVQEDVPNAEEKWLLEQWPGGDMGPLTLDFSDLPVQTDRTQFIRVRGLVADKTRRGRKEWEGLHRLPISYTQR